MTSLKRLFLVAFSVFFSVGAWAADERASTAEAQAMLKKAVAYLKANGDEKADAEFNNKASPMFHDRDLYVWTIDLEGKVLSHGQNDRLVGKNVLELTDADGKKFIKEYIQITKTQANGSVAIKWMNPLSKEIEPKINYIERVGGRILGVGAYQP